MARLPSLLRTAVSPPVISRASALTAMERISATTHLVSSLEYLVSGRDRERGGLNDWQVSRRHYAGWPAPARRALDLVSGRRGTRALHGVRVAAAAALLAPLPRRGRLAADTVLAATSMALYPRNRYGTDGSDQVGFLVQTTAAVARAAEHRPPVVDACLWYAGLQSVLSYATSGWTKVTSPTWRSGRALPGVMRTRSYGEAHTWRLVAAHPRAGHALSTAVLALECAFPLVLVGKGRAARPMVAAVDGFHLANAGVMGLGRFLTSFGSLHPAVLYIAGPQVRTWADGRVERRHDAFPAVVGGVLATALAAGAAARVRNRTAVLRGRGDEQTMTTSSGSTLAYRRIEPPGGADGSAPDGSAPDATVPLVVLATALNSTPEQAEWLVAELSRQHPVVTYQRAGIGRSRYVATRPSGRRGRAGSAPGHPVAASIDTSIDTAADDLADLVRHVAGERPVVLVGHALGGHLAATAARALPGRVAGVALIAPGHPGEARTPSAEDPDGRRVTDSLAHTAVSLRLCLGPLLKAPDWLGELPRHVRALALAQYRDPATWTAALREWRGTLARFGADEGPLAPLGAPVCLVVCGDGLTDEQRALQQEYAEIAPHARTHELDAHRDRVLTRRATATEVAHLLAEFTRSLGEDRRATGQEARHAVQPR
ncbi:Serine aminopeptidase, S33 [Actinacidiphila yanglinensis]|uniref:Serine aminopeptidase, S33 n=1 Tax=Actinacidiphila yanglinensis TaxID=310779 RepID=A0A1H6B0L4_9ACTN|nr:alpha/beta fold hydrolase [Actinacidiphila yanglinensis]SEG54329.1 Serine aminopeptidase, S33 [Actinacidiphila yanglinensis]